VPCWPGGQSARAIAGASMIADASKVQESPWRARQRRLAVTMNVSNVGSERRLHLSLDVVPFRKL
jgi:hypothetical protein